MISNPTISISVHFACLVCKSHIFSHSVDQIICIVHIFLNRSSSRYIVYDVSQINMKYLLKIKFNYQTSLW